MHGTLLAVTLAAYLLAPSSLFGRLWNLTFGSAPTTTTLHKEGPGLDPYGVRATSPRTDEGPGLDPSGITATSPATEAGPGLDPYGLS